jgi:hypothetical protein
MEIQIQVSTPDSKLRYRGSRYAQDDKLFSAVNVILCYTYIGWDSWNDYLCREYKRKKEK